MKKVIYLFCTLSCMIFFNNYLIGQSSKHSKNIYSKYLVKADKFVEVENYVEAHKLYEPLVSFKSDKRNALLGLLYCKFKLKDFKGIEEMREKYGNEKSIQYILEGIYKEYIGDRQSALLNYTNFLQTPSNSYIDEKLKYTANIAVKRLEKEPIVAEILNDNNPNFLPTNNIVDNFFSGGCLVDNKLYLTKFKYSGDNTVYSDILKKEGYLGSSSSIPNKIETKFYIGGLAINSNKKEIIISKQSNETLGFNSIKEKKFKKNTSLSSIGINNLQLFYSSYEGEFNLKNLDKLPFVNKEYNYVHPVFFDNGNKLIFSSDMPDGFGGYDLYMVERKDNEWSTPINLGPSINSLGDEEYPFILNDSLLFYSSNGLPGYGNFDIFVCEVFRGKFVNPKNLGNIFNSTFDDIGYFQFNKRFGLLISNRDGYTQDKIYAFEYPIQYRKLYGNVKDKLYDAPISDVNIKIYDGDSLIANLYSNVNGKFVFEYLLEDKPYKIIANKHGYKPNEKYIKPGSGNIFLESSDLLELEPIIEKKTVFRFNNILFDYGKTDLKDSSKIILDRLADLLINNKNVKVELSAHTDSRSSASFNLKLSQGRANSCVSYLISKGVLAENIISKGYGESKLLNVCKDGVPCSEEEHAINRRVEIKVLDVK